MKPINALNLGREITPEQRLQTVRHAIIALGAYAGIVSLAFVMNCRIREASKIEADGSYAVDIQAPAGTNICDYDPIVCEMPPALPAEEDGGEGSYRF